VIHLRKGARTMLHRRSLRRLATTLFASTVLITVSLAIPAGRAQAASSPPARMAAAAHADRAASQPTAAGSSAPQLPGVCTSSNTAFQPACAAVVVGAAGSPGTAGTPCSTAVMACPTWSDTYDGPATSTDMAFAG